MLELMSPLNHAAVDGAAGQVTSERDYEEMELEMTSKLQFSCSERSVGGLVVLGSVETNMSKVMEKSLIDDGMESKQRVRWKNKSELSVTEWSEIGGAPVTRQRQLQTLGHLLVLPTEKKKEKDLKKAKYMILIVKVKPVPTCLIRASSPATHHERGGRSCPHSLRMTCRHRTGPWGSVQVRDPHRFVRPVVSTLPNTKQRQ